MPSVSPSVFHILHSTTIPEILKQIINKDHNVSRKFLQVMLFPYNFQYTRPIVWPFDDKKYYVQCCPERYTLKHGIKGKKSKLEHGK